jgi:hypothetical protein
LHDDVFNTLEFTSWVMNNNVVLVDIDFPANWNAADSVDRGLCDTYHVDGFPSVLRVSSTGFEYGHLDGYLAGMGPTHGLPISSTPPA